MASADTEGGPHNLIKNNKAIPLRPPSALKKGMDMERDCKTCLRADFSKGEGNGCTAWECDYINRKEAIKVYEEWKKNHSKEKA